MKNKKKGRIIAISLIAILVVAIAGILKISSVDNVSTSSNLYIWYTIAILSIIGLSAIYIKNTY